jgi:hypothetical protein
MIYRYTRSPFDIENYVKSPASIDDVLKISDKGVVKFYPFDLQYPRKYTFEKDGAFFRIVADLPGADKKVYFATTDDGKDFLMTPKDDPEGEIKWRLVQSITGNKGYYSIASADTETYLYLDIIAGEAGVVDLADEDEVRGIKTPMSVNFTFTNPKDKATVQPIERA